MSAARSALSLAVPDEVVEAIAERAAKLASQLLELSPSESWIGVHDAAEHLACKPQRVYDLVSQGRLPHRKEGRRLLFRRSELDDSLEREASR